MQILRDERLFVFATQEQWPRIDTSNSVINGSVYMQMECCHMQIWTSLDEAVHTQNKWFCPAAFASARSRGRLAWGRNTEPYELYSVAFKSSGWRVCNCGAAESWNSYHHLIWNTDCDQISALLWINNFLLRLLTKSDAISPVNTESWIKSKRGCKRFR